VVAGTATLAVLFQNVGRSNGAVKPLLWQRESRPLTVQIAVPKTWKRFTVKQVGREKTRQIITMNGQTVARLDVCSNVEPALVMAVE
jgi:hypothetical protein